MKGISPLLASVLLIAVTVAIATLVMGWMSTTMRTTQTTVTNKTTEAVECSAANINIDEVYIIGTSANAVVSAKVVVRNSGQANDMQIISAQLYNSTGGNFSASSLPITDFDKGDMESLSFVPMIATCPGAFSKVIITTNCGGIRDTFDGTPKCA